MDRPLEISAPFDIRWSKAPAGVGFPDIVYLEHIDDALFPDDPDTFDRCRCTMEELAHNECRPHATAAVVKALTLLEHNHRSDQRLEGHNAVRR